MIHRYIQIGSENEVKVSDSTRNKILQTKGVKGSKPEELMEALDRAQREVLLMLAMDALPRFLQSDIFKEWSERETKNGTAAEELVHTYESRKGLESTKYIPISKKSSPLISEVEDETACIMRQAFTALDPLELPRIAKSHYLSTFLASVEGLPISVSLASASLKRRGFPLIYVNAIFAEITGYDRQDIIGRNCSFLQKANSEQASIELMVEALCGAKPIKVEITNYRKNGEPFGNLLAMKPIFNCKGIYSFVVGIQFDLTSSHSTVSALQMVDSLMAMLPDRLPRGDSYDPYK